MTAAGDSLFAVPRAVAGVEECLFYHTMDLPGVGVVTGPWDLRSSADDYLGHLDLRGKRALDVGTASGFLTFEMERRGAEVVSYDLSESEGGWDVVPFGGRPSKSMVADRAGGIGKLNNSWWLAHAAVGSKAKVVYGSVYDLPLGIGPVEVAVFGAILLHLRDPFLALQKALELTTERVVITEPAGRSARALGLLPGPVARWLAGSNRLSGGMDFLPHPGKGLPDETWWSLSPWVMARMVGVLGFSLESLHFHSPHFEGRPCPMYTLVGRRLGGYPGALRSVRT